LAREGLGEMRLPPLRFLVAPEIETELTVGGVNDRFQRNCRWTSG
jgi:hypothetical protein